MRHTRKTIAAASALILLGAVSGCASGDTASNGVTEITFTSDSSADTLSTVVTPLVEGFEKANPNIKVTVQTIPFSDYNTKLTTEFKAGGGPDVLNVNHTDIQTFSRGGFLEPLQDTIAKENIDTSALIPGLIDAGKVNGDQVTLPQTTDCRVLWVNPKLLKAKGIDNAPTTFDELLKDVKKFSGTDDYGFAFPTDSDYSMSYEDVGPLMKSAGGTILTSGTDIKADAADSEGTVAAVTLLQDIVATGATPPGQSSLKGDSVSKLFAQGKIAMMLGGPWVQQSLELVNPSIKYGNDYVTAPVPVWKAGMKSASTAGGWQMGIAKNSKKKEAAGKFLAFMMQKENLIKYSEVGGTFPPLTNGLDQAPWSEDPVFKAFNEVLPNSSLPITPVPRIAEVSAAFEQSIRPVVTGTGDVANALKQFDQQTNDSILN